MSGSPFFIVFFLTPFRLVHPLQYLLIIKGPVTRCLEFPLFNIHIEKNPNRIAPSYFKNRFFRLPPKSKDETTNVFELWEC